MLWLTEGKGWDLLATQDWQELDSEKSPCSHGWAQSQAANGVPLLLQPSQNSTFQTWPGHHSHPDKWAVVQREAVCPAKQQPLHSCPASNAEGWITSHASLQEHSRNQRIKMFKEVKYSPRGKCPYLPCRWASESKLFRKISARMQAPVPQKDSGNRRSCNHKSQGQE